MPVNITTEAIASRIATQNSMKNDEVLNTMINALEVRSINPSNILHGPTLLTDDFVHQKSRLLAA